MPAGTTKRFSRDDLKKVKWVQNISGADVHIPLNDEGKRGIVIKKDEVFELSSFFTDKQKLSCRALYDAFVGIQIGDGKPRVFLKSLAGPDDPSIIKTTHKINQNRFAKHKGDQMIEDKNWADVELLKLKKKELEQDIETLPEEEQEMRQAQIDAFDKKIKETEKQAQKDEKVQVTVVGGDGSGQVSAEGTKDKTVKDEDEEDEDIETAKDEKDEDADEDEESDEDEEEEDEE